MGSFSSFSALSSGSSSRSAVMFSRLTRLCLALGCSLTLAACLSPSLAIADDGTAPEQTPTQEVPNEQGADAPGDAQAPETDGDRADIQYPECNYPEGAGVTYPLAVRIDETQLRTLDYEAPTNVLYVGLGFCGGAVLGSVFTRGWDGRR